MFLEISGPAFVKEVDPAESGAGSGFETRSQ